MFRIFRFAKWSVCVVKIPQNREPLSGFHKKQKEAPQIINAYALMQRPKSVLQILP